MPTLEVQDPSRVGGATYQVPWRSAPSPPDSGHPLDRQLLPQRKEKTMAERLADEIMDAANNTGAP